MRLALQAYTEPPPSPSFEAEQEAKALQQTLHLKGGVAALFAYNELCKINDGEYGGFGRMTKHPRTPMLNFLFRWYARDRGGLTAENALQMALGTLDGMAKGGIRDHLGGGFFLRSTDRKWHVPVFQKTLPDNALILNSYVEAYLVTNKAVYGQVARETADFLVKVLQDPVSGGFFSAQDGGCPDPQTGAMVPGAYHAFTYEEVIEALGPDLGKSYCSLYGIRQGGNIESEKEPQLAGKNILMIRRDLDRLKPWDKAAMEQGKAKMAQLQAQRPKPLVAPGIMAGWTGLAIGSLARASTALRDYSLMDAAQKAAAFVMENLYDDATGTLRKLYQNGQVADAPATAEDYAFLIKGLIDLYEGSCITPYIHWARKLQAKMDELFALNDGHVGYRTDSKRANGSNNSNKNAYDGAMPSVTSVACGNMLRIGTIFEDQELLDRSRHVLAHLVQDGDTPEARHELLASLLLLSPSMTSMKRVVIAGRPGAEDTIALFEVLHQQFTPGTVIIYRNVDDDKDVEGLPSRVKDCKLINGKVTAYLWDGGLQPALFFSGSDPSAFKEAILRYA